MRQAEPRPGVPERAPPVELAEDWREGLGVPEVAPTRRSSCSRERAEADNSVRTKRSVAISIASVAANSAAGISGATCRPGIRRSASPTAIVASATRDNPVDGRETGEDCRGRGDLGDAMPGATPAMISSKASADKGGMNLSRHRNGRPRGDTPFARPSATFAERSWTERATGEATAYVSDGRARPNTSTKSGISPRGTGRRSRRGPELMPFSQIS